MQEACSPASAEGVAAYVGLEKIRQLQKENEYLKRQREILSLVLSSVDPRLC